MTKLELSPSTSGYSVKPGTETLSVKLDGGLSRHRKDIANSASLVSVSWVCDRNQFRYINSFYNLITDKGALPFELDLIIDNHELTNHTCKFVRGSFRLASKVGHRHVVTAQLEIKPIPYEDEDLELAFVVLYGEYGEDWESQFPTDESDIDEIINTFFPSYIPA